MADAVLISGSSGGIGLPTVRRFVARGYVALGIDIVDPPPGLRGLESERADVRDPVAVAEAVASLGRGHTIRHVVGLAGRVIPEEIGLTGQPHGQATRRFADSLDLNLTGQFNLLRAALDPLRGADGDRSVTFCSSLNALGGYGAPAYSAAKAGLIGMMNALVPELGHQGIRINVVAPGTTRTPLIEEEARTFRDRRRLRRARERVPLGRIAEPDQTAAAFESLALSLTHVTGEVLRVDGGQLLAP